MEFDPRQLPTWFLAFMVTVLLGYVAWSLPRHYNSLKDAIDKVGVLIEKLFDEGKDRERRLSHLEGEHFSLTCQGGRRTNDPKERI